MRRPRRRNTRRRRRLQHNMSIQDPAHDPERRSPRATRGSDENFLRTDSAAKAGSYTHEEATPTPPNQDKSFSGLADYRRVSEEIGEDFYTGNRLETVMDRLELSMKAHPLELKPLRHYTDPANKQSQKRIPRYIQFNDPDEEGLEHE